MSVDKLRRLLMMTPAAGLVGCATGSGPSSLRKMLGTQMEYGKATAMNATEAIQADQAAAVFAHFFKTKTVPVNRNVDVTPLSLRLAVADWNRALAGTQSKRTLTLTELAELSLKFVPVLNQIDAASTSLQTSAAHKIRPAAGKFAIHRGVLTIPAGGACQFTKKGYCLDPGIPAPGPQEKFRFVSIDRILPADLHPLYSDLMVAGQNDPTVRANMQGLVWLMRSVVNHKMGSSLTPSTRKVLNKIRPNGAAEFELARTREDLLSPLRSIANIIDGVASTGSHFDVNQLTDVMSSQRAVDGLMHQMSRMQANTPIPTDNSHMSMPQPGVAVMSIGSSLLTPSISIINANDAPALLDLTRYAAVSTRSVQRVAMALPDGLQGSQFPMVVGGNDSGFDAKSLGAILSAVLSDGANYLSGKMPEHVPAITEKIRPIWALAARSKLVRGAIETVPFVGNLLSAYELFTGQSWASPHSPLSPADRVLAGLGTIPGGGQLARLAGKSTAPLIKWALSSSGAKALGTVGDIREVVQDVSALATGDTAQIFGVDGPSKAAMSAFQDSVQYGLAHI